MDEELKDALEQDEKLLWEGRPESFVTLDKTNKQAFTTKAIITVLVCIALILSYYAATAANDNFKIGVAAVIAGFGMLIICSTFLDARKLRKQKYGITDRRLLWMSDVVRSVPYSSIKQYRFGTDEDGHTSLLIGAEAIKKKSTKWRTMGASSVFMNDAGECEQAVFYAISDPDRFKKIFEEQRKA